jgi:hypothetical protein
VDVLVELTGLDEAQRDASIPCPVLERVAGQLAAIVEPQSLGLAVQLDRLVHDTDRSYAEDRGRDLDPQRLAIAVIEHVQRPEPPRVVERIVHAVERPDGVELVGCAQWQWCACWHTLLRPRDRLSLKLQYTRCTLVVPAMTIKAQPVVALPEASPRLPGHHPVEHVDHHSVTPRRRSQDSVVRRPGQSHDETGLLDRYPMLAHVHLRGLTLHGRRYSSRDSTCLVAAFSSASSAYMRLSLALSASSSFMRLSSLTVTPPYFDPQLK